MKKRKNILNYKQRINLCYIHNAKTLASTYSKQGRWEAAEELEVEVMEESKKKPGADHPYTLTSMANLASMYRN